MQQQLYMASTSHLIKTRRRRSQILVPLAYIAFGIYALVDGDRTFASTLMFLVALIWLIFYPKYSAWRYKRHFKSWVNERHSELLNKEITLELTTEKIRMQLEGNESFIDWNEIERLIEFPSQFLFRMTSGSSIIVAKNDSYSAEEFKTIIASKKIEILDENTWEWK